LAALAAVVVLVLLVSDGEEQAEAPRPQVDQRADIDRIEKPPQDQRRKPNVPRDPAREAAITAADMPPGNPDAALDANESGGASDALASMGQPLIIERLLRSRTLDEGTVLIDGRTPARKLRRQWYERVEWYDRARGARIERIVPREQVVFVRIPGV
ncbi:MAG: hypothetical protein WD278_08475, partial [Pirellulales bacterium]